MVVTLPAGVSCATSVAAALTVPAAAQPLTATCAGGAFTAAGLPAVAAGAPVALRLTGVLVASGASAGAITIATKDSASADSATDTGSVSSAAAPCSPAEAQARLAACQAARGSFSWTCATGPLQPPVCPAGQVFSGSLGCVATCAA